jgi:ABC-2 type transport system ATP-binding protein
LRDDGRSVLLVSHSASDIERLADRVALLENGRITRDEELEHFARTPRGGIDLEAALARAELEVAQ